MDRAGHQLFPGPGLTRDEHGAARLGDEPRGAHDFLDRAAPADDAIVVVLLVALGDQVVVMRAEAAVFERPAHDHEELVDLERLLQIVERPEFHRLDRALHGGVRGHHQDLRPLAVARGARDFADEVEAAQLGHQVVDHQQVERPIAQQLQRLTRTAGRGDVMPLAAQRLGERLPDLRFVVDEQNGRHRAANLLRPDLELHGRAGIDAAVDADRPTQPLNDVAGDGQAKARAGPAGREEGLEDPGEIIGCDADAAIDHADPPPVWCRLRDLDADRIAGGRRRSRTHGLLRVGEDVHEHRAQALRIGDDGRPLGIGGDDDGRIPGAARRGVGGVTANLHEIGGARVRI